MARHPEPHRSAHAAGNLPDTELVPLLSTRQILCRVAANLGTQSVVRAGTQGFTPLIRKGHISLTRVKRCSVMMLRSILKGARLPVCLAFASVLACPRARADTYHLYEAAVSSGSIDTLGIRTDGTILMSTTYLNDPWLSFSPADGSYQQYAVKPAFQFDNGSTCAPAAVSGFTSVSQVLCNNGHFAMIASTSTIRQGVFDGTDALNDLVYNGLSGGLLLNSMGDIAFIGYNFTPFGLGDGNLVAYDKTTHVAAVTPEPSTFLMVGTALVGFGVSVRRRYLS